MSNGLSVKYDSRNPTKQYTATRYKLDFAPFAYLYVLRQWKAFLCALQWNLVVLLCG